MRARLEIYQQLAELLAGQVRAADADYVAPTAMDDADAMRDLLERAQRVQQRGTAGDLPGEEEALPRSVPPAAPRDGEIQSATWTTELPH